MNKIQNQIKEIEEIERKMIYYTPNTSVEFISKYKEIISIIEKNNNRNSLIS